MSDIDFDNDDQDGILFRFWIRAASATPSSVALALSEATTPADYRKALTRLAYVTGVNLPPAPDLQSALKAAGEKISELRGENDRLKQALADERELCAQRAEGIDRRGREWVPDSLWDRIRSEVAADIRKA